MTRKGMDYAFDPVSSFRDVAAAGYTFVCHYLGGSAAKDWTPALVQECRQAGLDLIMNWENSSSAALKGFGQGQADARAAATAAGKLGWPTTRPIYFSIDFDVTSAQLAACGAYMDGVRSVLGIARTGAYGGYAVIKYLFDSGKTRWGWQTYAWSGGRWDPRAQMRQLHNGDTIAGADADIDEAESPDFGQWGALTMARSTDDIYNQVATLTAMVNNYFQGVAEYPNAEHGDTREIQPVIWENAREDAVKAVADWQAQASTTLAGISTALANVSGGGMTDADRAMFQELIGAVKDLNSRLATP